ncbi:MAG: DUF4229 domain-containing protein [Actinomycetes bacterium]|nr:DUF4229 domain-containing protein [Actinomycetes bacterium]MDX5449584.1 DUF4229 domain-containing protein [Actinomycetes bacterium]
MALIRYSLIRLVLLLAAAALLYLGGLRGALLWIVAVVVAGLVAFIVLPRFHDRAAADLAHLLHRPAPRLPGEDEAHEDEAHEDEAHEDGTRDRPLGRGADRKAQPHPS